MTILKLHNMDESRAGLRNEDADRGNLGFNI